MTNSSSAAAPVAGGFFKRDAMLAIEKEMQDKWQEERLFEQDAPADGQGEKFMATFPYPYMNGCLHLGHSFSFSKAEFASAFERLKGKRVLLPFGFHCTGMPIVAAAEKLRKEIAAFGCPPQFPKEPKEEEGDAGAAAKHSKVAAKTGGVKYQWQIMEALGIPSEEISKFVDPLFWTAYFPPLAEADLRAMGSGIDWRRSFITTKANPFYDAFIGWQFRKLYAQGRIKFGKRHTIYSPLDGQPCLDHDRASGEGVDPKEYTCIKLQVVEPAKIGLDASASVCLVAATLRPETMYGQTNCWVGPEVSYGVFATGRPQEYFVCTERSARNMAHQDVFAAFGKVECVKTVKGTELIGLQIRGPLAEQPFYVLPMMSVVATIGTGIVTSVPASSPDDFATLRDLREKEGLRAKFGVQPEWVKDPIPVCHTEKYGANSAEAVVAELGIKSQNDRVLLDEAKEKVYKEEFYQGSMSVGPYKGMPVQQAKPKVTQELIQAQQAFAYHEPEKKVISRSGDECVVALCDQWFLGYGEPEWREKCKKCLSLMNVFMPEVHNQFEQTLDWMQQWACSRSFGLGTKLPWDPKYVIESLSDSTIYMAYYCVAHILHEGSLDGSVRPNGIQPEQMTDAVWEYVFGEDSAPFPSEAGISSALLERMRSEFRFFYPLDLRVSGKDLVPNHLTMSIYNHVALFPERFWPRAFRANGHLLLNSEKMSKSTGNFLTMRQAHDQFGADATRIALADSGDSVEDANFVVDTADKSVLRMYSSLEQLKEFLAAPADAYRTGELLTIDRVFQAEMHRAVRAAERAYERMEYREALKEALFELQNARDFYRDVCVVHGSLKMHHQVMARFFELSALALCPITPHLSDYSWRVLLNKPGTALTAGYPKVDAPSEEHLAIGAFVRKALHDLRLAVCAEQKKAPEKRNAEIYVALAYPAWQEQAIEVLRQHWSPTTSCFDLPDDQLVAEVRKNAPAHKKLVPFAMETKKKCMDAKSIEPLQRQLPFDELAVLKEHEEYVRLTLQLDQVSILPATSGDAKMEAALPGQPSIKLL